MTKASGLMGRLSSPYVVLLLPPLFWSSNAIAGRLAAAADIPPVALAFYRWLIALGLLLIIGYRPLIDCWDAIRAKWKVILALGALSAGAYNMLMYAALQTTTALNATLVASTLPVVMVVLARVWLDERLRPVQWSGILLGVCGVVLVVARGDLEVLLTLTLRQGDALMLLATLSWATYSVLLRKHPPGMHPVAMLTAQVAAGLVVLIPFYLWELFIQGRSLPLNATAAWLLPYTAVFPAIVAFYAWNKGIAAVGPSVASIYTNLVPVLTALMALVLLDEAIQLYHVAGMVLILGGIWLVTARPGGLIPGRRRTVAPHMDKSQRG